VALHYLARHGATVHQLRQVLTRRVDRALRVHGGDRAQALGWVEAVVARLSGSGYVNDAVYAETKARALRTAGRSARVITQKLLLKGVAADLVRREVAAAELDLSDEAAARIWAKKKRLGPYCRDAALRAELRQKHLAALARAGFSFATAKRLIDEAPDGENQASAGSRLDDSTHHTRPAAIRVPAQGIDVDGDFADLEELEVDEVRLERVANGGKLRGPLLGD
jgi:regulatory protein